MMHQALQEALDRDGYAVVRGVLSPQELTQLRRGFDDLVSQAKAGVETDRAQFVVDTDPFRLHRVVWAGGASPDILPFAHHPKLLALARLALQSETLVQLLQQAHFKLPGDGVHFKWHQDASNRRYGTPLWTDRNGRGSFIQLAIAVDPMTRDNGALRVLPGSHHQGFLADPTTGDLPPEVIQSDQAIDLLCEPGDVGLFGPFLIHGSPPNRTQSPRRLLIQGYTLPGVNQRVYPGCGTGFVHGASALPTPPPSGLGD